MKIRRNDDNGDWTFGHSLTNFYQDNDAAVGQKIKTRLQEWRNDCFFNQEAGIDRRVRMGQRGQRNLLDEDIRKIILDTEEVIALTEYSSSIYDRDMIVNFAVYHQYSSNPYIDSVTLQGVQYV